MINTRRHTDDANGMPLRRNTDIFVDDVRGVVGAGACVRLLVDGELDEERAGARIGCFEGSRESCCGAEKAGEDGQGGEKFHDVVSVNDLASLRSGKGDGGDRVRGCWESKRGCGSRSLLSTWSSSWR